MRKAREDRTAEMAVAAARGGVGPFGSLTRGVGPHGRGGRGRGRQRQGGGGSRAVGFLWVMTGGPGARRQWTRFDPVYTGVNGPRAPPRDW